MLSLLTASVYIDSYSVGTHLECRYAVMAFGIPEYSFPVNDNGIVDTQINQDWIQYLRTNFRSTIGTIPNHYTMDHNNDSNNVTLIEPKTPHLTSVQSPTTACTFLPSVSVVVSEEVQPTMAAKDAATTNPSSLVGTMNQSTPITTTKPATVKQQIKGTKLSSSSFSKDGIATSEITKMDVVFGKGRGLQDLPGNKRFRQMVDVHIEQYSREGQFGKTLLIQKIIYMIRQSGTRFLRQLPNGNWAEVQNDVTIHNKVSNAFRARRKVYWKQPK